MSEHGKDDGARGRWGGGIIGSAWRLVSFAMRRVRDKCGHGAWSVRASCVLCARREADRAMGHAGVAGANNTQGVRGRLSRREPRGGPSGGCALERRTAVRSTLARRTVHGPGEMSERLGPSVPARCRGDSDCGEV